MACNDKEFRSERRITAYVSPANKITFLKYRKKHGVPMSRALDLLLTEFFAKVKK